MSSKLVDYFNKRPRLGCLGTADKTGKVNVAYFGSPMMTDEKTIVMGLGKNRTFAYLQENPEAVFMIMEPAQAPPQWKGIRLYVRMTGWQTSGQQYNDVVARLAKVAGLPVAQMEKTIHAAVTFEIYEKRPLVDFGQGWEKSIGTQV